MIFYKNSITFDEVTYNPDELYEAFKDLLDVRKVLQTSKSGGKCEVVDYTAQTNEDLANHPIVKRFMKHFPVANEQLEKNSDSVRLFYHGPDAGIPPHVDERTNCALLFPICPTPIDPVIYVKATDKVMEPGDWFERSEFKLSDIDCIHQYTVGHPSLINSELPHFLHNHHETSPRVILRFKIKIKSFAECLEMCKNGTFVIKDPA